MRQLIHCTNKYDTKGIWPEFKISWKQEFNYNNAITEHTAILLPISCPSALDSSCQRRNSPRFCCSVQFICLTRITQLWNTLQIRAFSQQGNNNPVVQLSTASVNQTNSHLFWGSVHVTRPKIITQLWNHVELKARFSSRQGKRSSVLLYLWDVLQLSAAKIKMNSPLFCGYVQLSHLTQLWITSRSASQQSKAMDVQCSNKMTLNSLQL